MGKEHHTKGRVCSQNINGSGGILGYGRRGCSGRCLRPGARGCQRPTTALEASASTSQQAEEDGRGCGGTPLCLRCRWLRRGEGGGRGLAEARRAGASLGAAAASVAVHVGEHLDPAAAQGRGRGQGGGRRGKGPKAAGGGPGGNTNTQRASEKLPGSSDTAGSPQKNFRTKTLRTTLLRGVGSRRHTLWSSFSLSKPPAPPLTPLTLWHTGYFLRLGVATPTQDPGDQLFGSILGQMFRSSHQK